MGTPTGMWTGMRIAVRSLVAGTLVVAAGCSAEPAEEPFLVISGPRSVVRFELVDGGGKELWRLVADDPVTVSELVYGRSPAGFRQEVPAGGEPPRALTTGEPLILVTTTELHRFRHEGYVAGPARFAIDGWEMRLREAPLDGAASATYQGQASAGDPGEEETR